MPVYRLLTDPVFPPAHLATKEGLLAVGGDLSVQRLLAAYREGIFPWYSQDDPILWWAPDPRLVLYPSQLKVSRRLRRIINQNRFSITYDQAFDQVIKACAQVIREHQNGTWITAEMITAYIDLHEAGFAHSVEAWRDGRLSGGLYGVSMGGSFFGESMFHLESHASNVALVNLVGRLQKWGFDLIDCQVTTAHMIRMGAKEIPRKCFIKELNRSFEKPTRLGLWDKG